MIVGIDTGGTNVDAVLLDEGEVIASAKVPGEDPDPIESVLDRLLEGETPDAVERVVLATTLVLNAALQSRLPACTNVLVPGPGLHPRRAFEGEENHVAEGCIDPRGRVREEPAYAEEPTEEVVAITAKFGTRNPEPERTIREGIDRAADRLAVGHASGPGMNFPERAATTVANAKAKPIFGAFADDVAVAIASAGVDAPAYYLKGDGAMLREESIRSTPAHAVRGAAAASTLGLIALTGTEDAVCLDVGGTTTDVTRARGGLPDTEPVAAGDLETGYDGVRAVNLPIGGDSRISRSGLEERREGNAAAFGGDAPTLTDALSVIGAYEGGDPDAARAAFERFEEPEAMARGAVDTYVERVAALVDELAGEPTRLAAGGVLASQLGERIADAATLIEDVVVPEHAAVAGAVGCAVARVSVETHVRVDSARGTMTVTSVGTRTEDVERGRSFEDGEIESLATERAREAAREAGATGEDLPVEILEKRRFNVVENARVRGEVVDVAAQVEPGLGRQPGGGGE